MTKPKTALDLGRECFKVRLVLGGTLLHVLSETEPVVRFAPSGEIIAVDWKIIAGTPDGDTVGYVRWESVTALTWRRA
jgi:hypothetical protein